MFESNQDVIITVVVLVFIALCFIFSRWEKLWFIQGKRDKTASFFMPFLVTSSLVIGFFADKGRYPIKPWYIIVGVLLAGFFSVVGFWTAFSKNGLEKKGG